MVHYFKTHGTDPWDGRKYISDEEVIELLHRRKYIYIDKN